MHLMQILLPLYAKDGTRIPEREFAIVRRELTERFGGVTAYLRAAASGLWKSPDGGIDRDEMIMIEVVIERLEREWWTSYRSELEARFHQDALHLRAIPLDPF
jgi:hypothetical protein